MYVIGPLIDTILINGLYGGQKASLMRGHAFICDDKTSVLEPASNTVIFRLHGTLMKCPALEFYVTAAYGGIIGISNGNSRVAAALLQRSLSNEQNTFDDIEQYIETARIHPTGPRWVDHFLLPTVLFHQFEGAEREGEVQLKQLTMKRMMSISFLLDMSSVHVT